MYNSKTVVHLSKFPTPRHTLLQALQFQEVSVRRILQGVTEVSHERGLGYSPFHITSPFHPPVQGDTKILYIIYKGNVWSV
jgi:hypothetical protein